MRPPLEGFSPPPGYVEPLPKIYMSFDVESIGLHGEAFAVAYCVARIDGVVLEDGMYACPPSAAKGTDSDRYWVMANVPTDLASDGPCISPSEVRLHFWQIWKYWRSNGAVLLSDCGWPVEGHFLNACVDTFGKGCAPYPLYDLASALIAKGINPLDTFERLPSELPRHNPLADCRQTARLFLSTLGYCRELRSLLQPITP